jgi:hypothetical protein
MSGAILLLPGFCMTWLIGVCQMSVKLLVCQLLVVVFLKKGCWFFL